MNRLLTVSDICLRYACKEKTARRYMRQMEHMEKPLRVTENAVESWEASRTYHPVTNEPVTARPRKSSLAEPKGKFIISRVRPAR